MTTSRARLSLARSATEVYLLQGLGLTAALASSVLTARALGPAGKGAVDLYVLLTALVVEFGLLGMNSGMLFDLARRRRPLPQTHANALVVAGLIGAVGVAAALVAPQLVGSLLGFAQSEFAAVALALTPALVYGALWSSMMTGIDRVSVVYRLQLGLAALGAAGIALLGLTGQLTPATAIALNAALTIAAAAVQFLVLRRRHRSEPLVPNARAALSTMRYGLRNYPGAVANWLHFRIDQVVVAHVLGLEALGLYALGVRWAEMLWMIGNGIVSVAVYRIASSARADAAAFTWRLFVATSLVTASAGLALAIIATQFTSVLYGAAFAGSIMPLILLIPGVVAWDAARILSQYISYNEGRPGLCTAIAITGCAANAVVMVAAVPAWGINGAAVASSSSYFLVLIMSLFAFWRLRRASEADPRGSAAVLADSP